MDSGAPAGGFSGITALSPTRVYAGVEPSALFVSDDGGITYDLVRGLWDHPHRPRWEPGGGGLCLHTVLPDPADPERMWIAISTGGVYRTEDGGRCFVLVAVHRGPPLRHSPQQARQA